MTDDHNKEQLIDEIYQMMPHNKRGMNTSGVRQVVWESRLGGHRAAVLDTLSHAKLVKLKVKLRKYLSRQYKKPRPLP